MYNKLIKNIVKEEVTIYLNIEILKYTSKQITFKLNPNINFLKDSLIIYLNNSKLKPSKFNILYSNSIYTLNFEKELKLHDRVILFFDIDTIKSDLIYFFYSPLNYFGVNSFTLLDITPPINIPNGEFILSNISINSNEFSNNTLPLEIYSKIDILKSNYTLNASDDDYYYFDLNLYDESGDKITNGNFMVNITKDTVP